MSVMLSAFLLFAAVYSLLYWLPDYCTTVGPRPWENKGFWFILALGVTSTICLIMEISRAWA